MADNNAPAPAPVLQSPDDIAAHNAAVAAKVAAQDIFAQSNAGNPNSDAGPALDKLLEETQKADETAKTEAEKAAKAAEEAAKSGAPAPDPAAAAVAPAEDPLQKKVEELFANAPKLPPNASPKSSEAFASIKLQAAKDISERDAKLEALAKEIAALKEAASNPSTEQLEKEKELKDLRDWRTKLDVDFDPAFKSYDQKISQGREFIYAQLRKSPAVTEETIDLIKKFGGPEKVNMQKLWEKVADPTLQNIVQSQIAELAKVDFEKTNAIKAAKDNLEQYLSQRQTAFQNVGTAHFTTTQKELDGMLNSLEWWKPQTAKAEADEATKKNVESHNKFLTEAQAQMKEALQDDSPKMRAILITGTLQLFNLQRIHEAVKAELAETKKSLAEVTGKWEKVKSASRSRLEASGAPPNGQLPAPPKQDIFSTRAGDALDSLMKQVTEEHNAKLGAGG